MKVRYLLVLLVLFIAAEGELPLELAILSGVILAVMIIILMLWVGRHEIPPDYEAQKFIHKAYQQGLTPEQIVKHFERQGWHVKRAHKQIHHYHKFYHKKFQNGNNHQEGKLTE